MTPEEAAAWRPTVRRRALAGQVLCVATTRVEGTWTAYCGAVPGQDHAREAVRVLEFGDKLDEELAKALFPEFADMAYAT